MKKTDHFLGFIVGMSRAGTTWMSRCISKHPDVAVFGETLFWGRKYVQPPEKGYYTEQQLNSILNRFKKYGITSHRVGFFRNISSNNIEYLIDSAFGEVQHPMTPADVFSKICELIAKEEKKKWVIEKTPHHLNWIDRIIGYLPSAKFVVMFREPYSFMLSYKHQVDRQKLDGEKKRRKKRMYHPIGCALVWRKYARSTKNAIKNNPEKTILIEFNSILNDPQEALKKVQRFLNLKYEKDILLPQFNTSFPNKIIPTLNSEDIFWMNIIARKEMNLFNIKPNIYNPNWFRIIWSTAKIPFWALHIYKNIKNEVEGNWISYMYSWVRTKSKVVQNN